MAAAQLRYTSLFSYTALLLIGYSLYDVETSSCERNIHKKVGDTVELSSCSPAEGVTSAYWKYEGLRIARKNVDVSGKHQFEGRLDLNPSSLDLTVRGLTLQDSGVFSFLSEVNNKQRPTVTITLHVHEPITIAPAVTSNSTWYPLNQSCTVLLECSATTDSPGVTYTWAVGNETMNGSSLQHVITPQDGDTRFTCTISNFVNEKSTIETVKCTPKKVSHFSPPAPLIIGTVIGILVFILLLLALLFYTKSNELPRMNPSSPCTPLFSMVMAVSMKL
ncbi:SLAM family member 5-like isoform X2 [Anoplopoma fimbria]|uniref:SLAM family member 5-like isoform X2 n=1 Tax=Anoplopoma fimbria TaxID=229290 RepID=UPI0023EC62BE|nr:SLAM family member 5-like isoform X2 [Anoplopoma fimbria]XP_054457690.1 SLAM family member 5-like isoform X2 [Anoplopoma fimbria]